MKNQINIQAGKIVTLLIYITTCFFSFQLNAQSKKDTNNIAWIGVGVGGCDRGISEHINLNLCPNKFIVSVRYTRIVELSLFSAPVEKINEFSYMMGFNALNSDHVKIRIQGGLGFLSGTKKGERISSGGSWFGGGIYREDNLSAIGIPFEISFDFCADHAGFGISGYANINKERPFAGVSFKLLIGKLKQNKRKSLNSVNYESTPKSNI